MGHWLGRTAGVGLAGLLFLVLCTIGVRSWPFVIFGVVAIAAVACMVVMRVGMGMGRRSRRWHRFTRLCRVGCGLRVAS